MQRTGRLRQAVVAVVIVALLGRPAAAHQFATRFEAPLPLPLLFAGAGATVALTAVVLGRLGTLPTGRRTIGTVSPRVARTVRALGRGLFALAVVGVLVDGLAGPRAPGGNLATLFVWAVWIKGLTLWAVLAGNPWRTLSPWRALYDGLVRLEGDTVRWRPYPARLGYWPAFVGFLLLIGIAENLTRIPRLPSATAGVVAVYGLLILLGGVAFGPEWFDRADPLAVLYRLLGRAAPISAERTGGGGWTVSARTPWSGCTDRLATPGAVPFVVAAVYTVSFDGFAESGQYQGIYFAVRDALGLGPTVSVLLYLVGLAGFLVVYVAVASLVSRIEGDAAGVRAAGSGAAASSDRPPAEDDAVRRSDGGTGSEGGTGSDGVRPPSRARSGRTTAGPTVETARGFAASVLPIAAAYEVAHNVGYTLTFLGELPRVLDLPTVDPLFWLPLPAFWGAQVVLVVLGHVVAVAAAHRVARRRTATDRRALLAHAPLVALMVGYTVLSLWIVSLPVAN